MSNSVGLCESDLINLTLEDMKFSKKLYLRVEFEPKKTALSRRKSRDAMSCRYDLVGKFNIDNERHNILFEN